MRIGGNVGAMTLVGFGADTTGVIDLVNGAGGYGGAADAYAALTSDGHGGSLLSLGADGAIDFAGTSSAQLSQAQFKIG